MSLRSLLVLAMAAPAYAAYEWYGVVKLAHSSEYDLTIKTLDETMNLYIAEVNEGTALDVGKLDTIVDGAAAMTETSHVDFGDNFDMYTYNELTKEANGRSQALFM